MTDKFATGGETRVRIQARPAFLQCLAAIIKRVIANRSQARDVLVGQKIRGGREIFRLKSQVTAQETGQRRFSGSGKRIFHAL